MGMHRKAVDLYVEFQKRWPKECTIVDAYPDRNEYNLAIYALEPYDNYDDIFKQTVLLEMRDRFAFILAKYRNDINNDK